MKNLEKTVCRISMLFTMYTPQEVEDIIFEAFERAHQYSDGDTDVDRENRAIIHAELRTIIRTLGAVKVHRLLMQIQKLKSWKKKQEIQQNSTIETI